MKPIKQSSAYEISRLSNSAHHVTEFTLLKVEVISEENVALSGTASCRHALVAKCYIMCCHMILGA